MQCEQPQDGVSYLVDLGSLPSRVGSEIGAPQTDGTQWCFRLAGLIEDATNGLMNPLRRSGNHNQFSLLERADRLQRARLIGARHSAKSDSVQGPARTTERLGGIRPSEGSPARARCVGLAGRMACKCRRSMGLCGSVPQLGAASAGRFWGLFRPGSEASACPTPELSHLARRTSEAVHSVVCLAKSAGSAPGVCWLRVDRPPTHLGGMQEPFFSSGDRPVGVKKTGRGRRKLGQKKRRMRARIRHRKK
jgi:hypothetical protein